MTWDFPRLSRDPSTSSYTPHLLPCWGPGVGTSLSPTLSFHLGEIFTLFSFLEFVPSQYQKEAAILTASAWLNFALLFSSQDPSSGPVGRQCLGHLAGTFLHAPQAEQGLSPAAVAYAWLQASEQRWEGALGAQVLEDSPQKPYCWGSGSLCACSKPCSVHARLTDFIPHQC